MFERIKHMLIKEFLQIFRDFRMRGIIFVMPVVQLVVFSYAMASDVRIVALAVFDLDKTPLSRQVISTLVGSGYFNVVGHIHDDIGAQDLLDKGKAQAIIRMNPGFEGQVKAGRTAPIQLLLDGTETTNSMIINQYIVRILSDLNRGILLDRISRQTGTKIQKGVVELRNRAWFNENYDNINFFVPGVMIVIVTLVSLMLTAMAIVREKEIGTMEQIMVSPITPFEFILGKTFPFALIGMVDVVIVMIVGVFWFEIPLRGEIYLLFLATALFLLTTLGIGLFISTISKTQQQALMSTFFFFQPAIFLSGFAFPIANMPTIIQYFTYLNPLRYFLIIVRGVFLKGSDFSILWPEFAALLVMGIFILWSASRRFQKTLS